MRVHFNSAASDVVYSTVLQYSARSAMSSALRGGRWVREAQKGRSGSKGVLAQGGAATATTVPGWDGTGAHPRSGVRNRCTASP
jgi:hypothetical protein